MISIDLVYSTDVVKDRKLVEVKHSIRDYLCVTDFMANEYIPTIDFTKPLIFTKTRKLQQVQVGRGATPDTTGAVPAEFLDWAKAFCSLHVGKLRAALDRFGLPEHILEMLRNVGIC